MILRCWWWACDASIISWKILSSQNSRTIPNQISLSNWISPHFSPEFAMQRNAFRETVALMKALHAVPHITKPWQYKRNANNACKYSFIFAMFINFHFSRFFLLIIHKFAFHKACKSHWERGCEWGWGDTCQLFSSSRALSMQSGKFKIMNFWWWCVGCN